MFDEFEGWLIFQVGAPPEIASLLEEIGRGNELCRRNAISTCLGADPELDEFMVVASSFILEISRISDSFNKWFIFPYFLSLSRKPTARYW